MTLTIEASGRSLARAGRVLAVPLLPGDSTRARAHAVPTSSVNFSLSGKMMKIGTVNSEIFWSIGDLMW